MMKINKDLASDKAWQLYVSCGVRICMSGILYLQFWKVRVWSSVGIFHIHNVFVLWVFIRNFNKGWWVKFDRTLEDCIHIFSINYCYLCCLNYVHYFKNLFYLHILSELWGLVAFLGFENLSVLLCQTMCVETHEKKIGPI